MDKKQNKSFWLTNCQHFLNSYFPHKYNYEKVHFLVSLFVCVSVSLRRDGQKQRHRDTDRHRHRHRVNDFPPPAYSSWQIKQLVLQRSNRQPLGLSYLQASLTCSRFVLHIVTNGSNNNCQKRARKIASIKDFSGTKARSWRAR